MKKIITKKILLLVLIYCIFLFTVGQVSAQAIDVNSDAPNTTEIVNDALAGGATLEEAAQAGADYLNSVGFDASVSTNPDGSVSIVCDNGSLVVIPSDPPDITIFTDDPPPPPPSTPSDGPVSPPGNPFDPVPDDSGSPDDPSTSSPPDPSVNTCGTVTCNPADPTICQRAGCSPCNATTRTCQPPSGGSCNGTCDPSNPSACSTRGGAGCICNSTTRICQSITTSGARCQCESLTFTGTVGAGQPITIIARASVTGRSVTCPTTIGSYDFTLYEGPKGSADTNSTIRNGPINQRTLTLATSISNTILCQSSWSLTLPTDPTKEYRILAKAKRGSSCTSGITRAESEMETLALLPVTNNDKTVIGFVKEFFNRVLGFSSYITIPANAQQNDQLQLNTFLPDGATYSNNCNLIKFAF